MFALSALSCSICNSDTPRMMAGEISDGSKWPDMHATATFFFFRLVKSCKTCASGYVCVTSRNASLTHVRTTARKSTWCFRVCVCVSIIGLPCHAPESKHSPTFDWRQTPFQQRCACVQIEQDERLLPDELRSTEFRQLVEGAH